MKHIIRKQVFQLAIGPGVEAFGAQHAASRCFRDVLLPLLQRAFDELASEGTVIRMDRIVLDLGTLSEQQLNRNFPKQEIFALLKAQLRQLMNGGQKDVAGEVPKRVGVFEQWWYYMEKGRLPWNADTMDAEWHRLVLETLSIDYEVVSRLRRALEERPVFRRRVSMQHPDPFLETLTGILTGMKQESLTRLVEEACSLGDWLEKRSSGVSGLPEMDSWDRRYPEAVMAGALRLWRLQHRHFLSEPAGGRKAVIWELVLLNAATAPVEWKNGGAIGVLSRWLSADDQIHGLLERAGLDSPLIRFGYRGPKGGSGSGTADPEPTEVWPESKPGQLPGGDSSGEATPGAKVPPPPPNAGGAGPDTGKSGQAIPAGMIERDEIPAGKRIDGQGDIRNKEQEDAEGQTATDESAVRERSGLETMPGADGELTADGSFMAAGDAVAAAGGMELVTVGKDRLFERRQVDEDGLFGQYAGLILLHPYLATFFTRAGLYDDGGFMGMQARRQAVFLLYYLATGEREAPEHELLFPKLYCGCDPEEPLPVRMEQTESNYAEADELLEMVLQRWEKLQHSSVGALREGFLQRVGKLVDRNGRLVLVIETSAIDVLLDYLPWNLSIVKLPWMKDLFYVEWR